ncbi:uncharacterized protein LOC134443526 [Engraulis encrasicolus]|uniref:uncharacterized protein LOC134443526 n=1 Tax=Engraulis encrasicolus TaxID=184585 RepID=UPI002FD4EB62
MDPPTNVEVTDAKADSITLTWVNPAEQQRQFLIIEYRMRQETEWTQGDPVKKTQETVTLSGLKPDTEYEIRATAVGKLGYASSDAVTAVTAKAVISPPTNVKVTQVKANSITLTWSIPEKCGGLKQYIIEYKEDDNSSDWQREETKTEMYTFTLRKLKPNTTYSIRICSDAGKGVSLPGEEIMNKTEKGPSDTNSFTPLSGTPPIYLLNMKRAESEINKMFFGEESSRNPSNKTIMVVGATGSGKTTLINGMVNYILGVDWEDNWRFKLVDEDFNKSQAHSQTSEVTAYQIQRTDEFRSEIPYSLTIIDTPGFGDTRGIKQDREITERIRQFFTNKDGIDAIDAVCFVVQAALARLTHTQRYIFEAILSVFGKNIASNIITLVTFADGKSPPVLEAIKEAKIPCATQKDGTPVHFKFNNSVLFANNTAGSDDEDFDYMFWKMGKASMNKFFTHLGMMETQSLMLTKQVLEERKQLEATVQGVQPLIRQGLATMEEIRSTQAILEENKAQIQANKNFQWSQPVPTPVRINIPSGTFITNCHGCNFTCHYPCQIPNDADKSRCGAMSNGKCTVCPGGCVWCLHHNMTYRWDTITVTQTTTFYDLKSKYEEAMGEKMNQEQIMVKLEEEYNQVQAKVLEMMETLTKCLKRLKAIALRSDPLSTPDYIDLMIESEKQQAKPGWQQRIKELQEVREGALLVQKAAEKIVLTGEEQSKLQKLRGIVKGAAFGFLKKFN